MTGLETFDSGAAPTVLCLHGFPQNATVFTPLILLLAAKGIRVLAPNQRGYTADTAHLPRRSYVARNLAEDCLRILDEQSVGRCIVLGHDLGAAVAWELSRIAPDRVSHLVIVGAPHPAAFLQSLFGIRQLARSWYFIVAQSTWLSEVLFSPRQERSRRCFEAFLIRTGLNAEDASTYVQFLATNRLFRGAIRWYQAMLFEPLKAIFTRCRSNVTVLWGTEDRITTSLSIRLTRHWVNGSYELVEVKGGGHWLPDYNYSEIADRLAEIQQRV